MVFWFKDEQANDFIIPGKQKKNNEHLFDNLNGYGLESQTVNSSRKCLYDIDPG